MFQEEINITLDSLYGQILTSAIKTFPSPLNRLILIMTNCLAMTKFVRIIQIWIHSLVLSN